MRTRKLGCRFVSGRQKGMGFFLNISRGQECGHCHLCPDGEIKVNKGEIKSESR